jgi:hypothetical protein
MLFVCDSLVHWWSVVTLAILQTVIHCANWVAGAYRGNLPTVCQYWWGSLCRRLWKWLDIVLRKVNRNVMLQEFADCGCQLESLTARPASCYEGHGFESGPGCGLLSLRVSVVFSPSTQTSWDATSKLATTAFFVLFRIHYLLALSYARSHSQTLVKYADRKIKKYVKMNILVLIVTTILISDLFCNVLRVSIWSFQTGKYYYYCYYFISDVITLLSVCLLGNVHLSQTAGGVRFSEGKENRPIP